MCRYLVKRMKQMPPETGGMFPEVYPSTECGLDRIRAYDEGEIGWENKCRESSALGTCWVWQQHEQGKKDPKF
jgi:hypothetical protein